MLIALTHYSSKRLRTIRLTEPEIVATLMDQILKDTSSGPGKLATNDVIIATYDFFNYIERSENKSQAFANSFKSETKLKRQRIHYALRQLGYNKSSVYRLWGNGTNQAHVSFAAASNLTDNQPSYIFSNLLSRVNVPSSFVQIDFA